MSLPLLTKRLKVPSFTFLEETSHLILSADPECKTPSALTGPELLLIIPLGIVANARLHLKMHQPKEVYLGFLSGLIAPFVVYNFL